MTFASAPTLPRWFKARATLGFVIPLILLLVLGLYFWLESGWLFLILPLVYYAYVPVIDWLHGRDLKNLSMEQEAVAERDPGFRAILYIAGGLYALAVTGTLLTLGYTLAQVWAGTLHWVWPLVLVIGASFFNGSMILLAHELGHGHRRRDRLLARGLLSLIGYGHFTLEHNADHHRWVSTPKDCASARYGESLYAFALRELPGAVRGAIALEKRRLGDRGFWHLNNTLLQAWAGTLIFALPFILLFGVAMIPLLILHHLGCWFMLTKANYVEHYGLGRREIAEGRYEPVKPHHSWNSDYWLTNALSFNLQRHSARHANASREYQILRTQADVPHLPAGYPGSFLLALIPPLWFRVMDPKVEAWAKSYNGMINKG